MVLKVIVGFIVLVIMIITHELGHYFGARMVGVKAEQFSIGFGPEIWGRDGKDTRFSIKWIPAGGSVRILGMDPDEEVSEEDFPRSYQGVSTWKRAVIIVAGSVVHFLIALILFYLIFWPIGYPVLSGKIARVQKTIEINSGKKVNGPGYVVGIKKGDRITAVNGIKIKDWNDLTRELSSRPGKVVTLKIKRDGRELKVKTRLLKTEDGRGILGIEVDQKDTITFKYNPLNAAWEALKTTGQMSWLLVKGLGKLFTPETFKILVGIQPRTQESPRGMVGAAQLASQAAEQGISVFIFIIAEFFLLLAIFNLIPLPPLDGGYLLVIVVEKLFHKEIDLKKLAPISIFVITVLVLIAIRLALLDIFNPLKNPFAP